MPVIVIGADTPLGRAIVEELVEPEREVRAFLSDPHQGSALKELGVKVATGDVSDVSHVEAACTNCFSAVLVTAAVEDGREMAFAREGRRVLEGWAGAVSSARVHRTIWVTDGDPPPVRTPEAATVSSRMSASSVAVRVAELDEAATLP